MGGQGTFKSEALGLDITADPDMVTKKLPALKTYQFSLEAPKAPEGSFNTAAADKGEILFNGKANCVSCHSGAEFTDIKLHNPEETGSNPDYATMRGSKIGQYRTTPLKGIWSRAPYFHDGAHATLPILVEHYDTVLETGLSVSEKDDLVEYLKSL
jgi:cytochrome c peroxidase